MKKVAPYGITPPCRAIPLRIAPIPCSRTPKWKFRPPGSASGRNSPPILDHRLGRRGKVRRPSGKLRHLRGDRVQHLAGRAPGGHRACLGRKRRDPLRPPLGEIAPHPSLPFEGKRRERGGVRGELHPPLLLRLLPARQRLPEVGENVVGHEEGRGGGPPEAFLREGDLGLAQRRPVRGRGVLLVGAAVPDARPNDHKGGALPLTRRPPRSPPPSRRGPCSRPRRAARSTRTPGSGPPCPPGKRGPWTLRS